MPMELHRRALDWVVERCFAWLSRNRRLAKDYERKVQTSETFIEVAATRLVLRRLAAHMYHE
jgi:putative transposase